MKERFLKIQSFSAPLRIGIFLLFLFLIWSPVALAVLFLLGDRPNLMTILTMGWLFILFFLLIQGLGRWLYQQEKPYQEIGLIFSSRNGLETLQGLTVGLGLTFSLFLLQGTFGWLNWQENSLPFWRLILEGALVGIGVAFAEETFFRGWLLHQLERDYSFSVALWSNSFLFAIAHFFKPISVILETLPAFPGLLILGAVLVLAKRRNQGRLGLAIGLHGGLVWGYYIINVGALVSYTQTVSPAITGIYGNPIAGVMGWVFLLRLAMFLREKKD